VNLAKILCRETGLKNWLWEAPLRYFTSKNWEIVRKQGVRLGIGDKVGSLEDATT